MESCPSCSEVCIPRWRRFFSRTERFRCPRCSTWLRYQKARRPPPLFLQRIRHPLVRVIVFILIFHLCMVGLLIAAVHAKCLLAQIPDRWLLSGMGVVLVGGIFLSERSILRSLRLVVAEYQMPKPQWDFARDLRAGIAAGAGWKHLAGVVVCLALMFGGIAAWRPIMIAVSQVWPIPCACMKPGRAAPSALPRCSV